MAADAGTECYLIYIELNPAVALKTSTFKLTENGGVEMLKVVGLQDQGGLSDVGYG